jgi:hypothetical protein
MPTMPTPTRTCRTCGRTLPWDQFRIRRDTGKPRSPCRACFAAYQRARRAKERDQIVRQFLAGLAHNNYWPSAVRHFGAAALRRFGSHDRLACAVKDYSDHRPAQRSRVLCRVLGLIRGLRP